jgi:hypothetical protein
MSNGGVLEIRKVVAMLVFSGKAVMCSSIALFVLLKTVMIVRVAKKEENC